MGTLGEVPLILVIDDDEAVLQVYREVLEDEGYRLSLRMHPPASTVEIQRTRPDLILLDLIFGGEDTGWRFLQHLKANPTTATIPVVVATADHRLATAHRSELDAWHCDLILKPFDIDELSATVRDALDEPVAGSQ
jgi:CheY-like chemotaxis protein